MNKRTFISGLAVVVPFALTIWILVTVFGSVDAFINVYLDKWIGVNFTGLGVILAVATIYIVGLVTQTKVGKFFYNLVNRVVFRVPLINKIYKLIKETIDVVTTKQAFKTVVKVEFPRDGVFSVGFLTNENTVFIPTTPNPTSGFLIKTTKYEIIDMSVENALRFIVSMGTIGDTNGQ
jgi:uncharacterized membrane protein